MTSLGRREPPDWVHVERYPYTATAPADANFERTLALPRYRALYDQGPDGACVGFASSWMVSILNRRQYDAHWLWDRAKEVDQWPMTNPGDQLGTSVRAAMDILRSLGHSRIVRGASRPYSAADGILENRWATSVDAVRTSISGGTPVVFGANWYANFDRPVKRGSDWTIGAGDLGVRRGGHATCLYRVSDRRQAVGLVNNWGTRYPLVWMPYPVLERLLAEHGEATLVTDRP